MLWVYISISPQETHSTLKYLHLKKSIKESVFPSKKATKWGEAGGCVPSHNQALICEDPGVITRSYPSFITLQKDPSHHSLIFCPVTLLWSFPLFSTFFFLSLIILYPTLLLITGSLTPFFCLIKFVFWFPASALVFRLTLITCDTNSPSFLRSHFVNKNSLSKCHIHATCPSISLKRLHSARSVSALTDQTTSTGFIQTFLSYSQTFSQ